MNRSSLSLVIFFAACTATPPPATIPDGTIGAPADMTSIAAGAQWDPAQGFVVHEWGTDTIVVGSDGVVQRGLHHEEEDLPAFVYDRMKNGLLAPYTSVQVKMETPVLYFYSATPLAAQVAVDFPAGVMTQWYPAVAQFFPMLGTLDFTPADAGDPIMDLKFPFRSSLCRSDYPRHLANGTLDWGQVEVLARDAIVNQPDAPLDRYQWARAREVAANGVRVANVQGRESQDERFLFYRGLGNFALPLTIEDLGAGKGVRLSNSDTRAVGPVFLVRVDAAGGAFVAHPEGLQPGAALIDATQLTSAPIDKYVDDLSAAMVNALDSTGLYHDEAQAMVATWSRQWFRTPGTRVLYLASQPWTEGQLPLHVTPAPVSTVRVMMIRTEIITPDEEQLDSAALAGYPTDPAMGRAWFVGLGRFGEPRLRNAVRHANDPAWAQPLVDELAGVDTRVAAGE